MQSIQKEMVKLWDETVLELENKILDEDTSLAELQQLKYEFENKFKRLENEKNDICKLALLCKRKIEAWGKTPGKQYRIF